jgi:hypothetical protein
MNRIVYSAGDWASSDFGGETVVSEVGERPLGRQVNPERWDEADFIGGETSLYILYANKGTVFDEEVIGLLDE